MFLLARSSIFSELGFIASFVWVRAIYCSLHQSREPLLELPGHPKFEAIKQDLERAPTWMHGWKLWILHINIYCRRASIWHRISEGYGSEGKKTESDGKMSLKGISVLPPKKTIVTGSRGPNRSKWSQSVFVWSPESRINKSTINGIFACLGLGFTPSVIYTKVKAKYTTDNKTLTHAQWIKSKLSNLIFD